MKTHTISFLHQMNISAELKEYFVSVYGEQGSTILSAALIEDLPSIFDQMIKDVVGGSKAVSEYKVLKQEIIDVLQPFVDQNKVHFIIIDMEQDHTIFEEEEE